MAPGCARVQDAKRFCAKVIHPTQRTHGRDRQWVSGDCAKDGAVIRQIIENQISYLKLTVTSLMDFVKDELKANIGLPEAFVQSVRDRLHGNIKGTINDALASVLHLFVTDLQSGLDGNYYVYSWLGALPDLWHLLQTRGRDAKFGRLAQTLGIRICRQVGAGSLRVSARAASQRLGHHIVGILDNQQLGPWLQFTLDMLGASIVSLKAFEDSVQAAFDSLVMGHPLRAAVDVMDVPFNVSKAFLFGQDYIALPPVYKADGSPSAHEFYVHEGDLFAPGGYVMDYYTPSWSGISQWVTFDDGGKGPQTGGIIPAMVSLLPPILQAPFHDLRRLLDGIAAKLMGLSALDY